MSKLFAKLKGVLSRGPQARGACVQTNTEIFTYTRLPSALHARALDIVFQRNRSALSGFSILAALHDEKTALLKLISEDGLSVQEDRALGCFMGMPVGDALGAPLEFQPVRYEVGQVTYSADGSAEGVKVVTGMGSGRQGAFHLMPGQWTDDSSMGLCLADSLLSRPQFDPTDLMLRFAAWWFAAYNNAFALDSHRKESVGLGGNINESLTEFLRVGDAYTKAGNKFTSGNGSIMRLAAVGVLYHGNIEQAQEVAQLQSLTTHQGEEAAHLARLMAFIIVTAINYPDTQSSATRARDILDNLGAFHSDCESVMHVTRSQQEGDDADRNWNWKNPNFRYSVTRCRQNSGYMGSYAMDGMCMALHCLYHTNSFPDALLKCANMCGDADSTSSICGQMAGAMYGLSSIPEDWVAAVTTWDGGADILLRAYKLFHNHTDLHIS